MAVVAVFGRRRRRRAWDRWLGVDRLRIVELVDALDVAASRAGWTLDDPTWRRVAVAAHDAGVTLRRRWAEVPTILESDAVLLLGAVEWLEDSLLRLEVPATDAVAGAVHSLTAAVRLTPDAAPAT